MHRKLKHVCFYNEQKSTEASLYNILSMLALANLTVAVEAKAGYIK